MSFVVFFCFLLPTVVLGVVALGIKLEPVLGVEVALGVGVVPGALLPPTKESVSLQLSFFCSY